MGFRDCSRLGDGRAAPSRPRPPSAAETDGKSGHSEGRRKAREPERTRLGFTWRLPSVTRRNAAICALLGGSAPGQHSTRNGQNPTNKVFFVSATCPQNEALAVGRHVSKARG